MQTVITLSLHINRMTNKIMIALHMWTFQKGSYKAVGMFMVLMKKKKGVKARRQSSPWSMAAVTSGLIHQASYSCNSRGSS